MKVIKFIITIVAVTMAVTLIFTTKTSDYPPPDEAGSQPSGPAFLDRKLVAEKRVSRFLQEKEKNPRAADHCHKDNEICNYILEGRNATCCNNKCIDLGYDSNNCGACKNKCAFTESCCRGQCVNLAYDKRHCGACNHRCMPGGYCIYGMCDYA
ncbi:Stigma-specific STIG1-like protein 1 [Sesamum angolense]|uniref:Stigma-specific STIG1-like protein 1 n=1 Tax=Sesamum angolense TaxID=2727404 RepID=A0AAE2BP68_9LAMI|nr:Stigma-specific STIG1-like protein 1 [Sesamum angolense]